jgi:hypothetical protein
MGISRGLACLILSYMLAKLYSIPVHFPHLPDLKILFLRNSIMTVQGFLFAFSFQYL